jgi:hypothetical protein
MIGNRVSVQYGSQGWSELLNPAGEYAKSHACSIALLVDRNVQRIKGGLNDTDWPIKANQGWKLVVPPDWSNAESVWAECSVITMEKPVK